MCLSYHLFPFFVSVLASLKCVYWHWVFKYLYCFQLSLCKKRMSSSVLFYLCFPQCANFCEIWVEEASQQLANQLNANLPKTMHCHFCWVSEVLLGSFQQSQASCLTWFIFLMLSYVGLLLVIAILSIQTWKWHQSSYLTLSIKVTKCI